MNCHVGWETVRKSVSRGEKGVGTAWAQPPGCEGRWLEPGRLPAGAGGVVLRIQHVTQGGGRPPIVFGERVCCPYSIYVLWFRFCCVI